MRWSPTLFRWHRWLGYLVALQVLAWVVGGVVFSWVPFQGWVKSGDLVKKATQPLPAHWATALGAVPTDRGDLLALQSVATASGPGLKLRYAKGEVLISANTGQPLPTPQPAQIAAFAQSLYMGQGQVGAVTMLDLVPHRLGIVREMGEKQNVWQVQFSDSLGSRLYFDGSSGEFLAARNEAWVLYDFLWRLHVMDYREGGDFNNMLLRMATIAALFLTLTGLIMSTLAIRRSWRRRKKR
jgi:PepSY-associated TM region